MTAAPRFAVDVFCGGAELLENDHEPNNTRTQLSIFLSWYPDDPYAAVVDFYVNRKLTTWLIAVDLLAEGTSAPAGDGDVYVRPDPDDHWSVLLELESDSGQALFRLPVRVVSEFVAKVDEAMCSAPAPDWDSELATWLEAS